MSESAGDAGFAAPGEATVEVTAVGRVTAVAFEAHDIHHGNEDKGSPFQLKRGILNEPTNRAGAIDLVAMNRPGNAEDGTVLFASPDHERHADIDAGEALARDKPHSFPAAWIDPTFTPLSDGALLAWDVR